MGSHQQMIVGILLLAFAFIFGRYIHSKPAAANKEYSVLTETDVSTEPLPKTSVFLDAETTDKTVVTPFEQTVKQGSHSLQQSLRERILGKRLATEKRKAPANDLATKSPFRLPNSDFEQSEPKKLNRFKEEIVKPDFSHLNQHASSSAALPSEPLQTDSEFPADEAPVPISRDGSLEPVIVGPLHHAPTPAKLPAIVALRPMRDQNTAGHQPVASRLIESKSIESKSKLTNVRRRSQHLSVIAKDYLTHTSEPGDTLHNISTRFYGRPDYYLDIYIANRDTLRNPSVVPAGLILKIPVYRD